MTVVDEHLAQCRPAERELLQHYRELVHAQLAEQGLEAREVTSYRMPAIAVGPGAKQVVCSFLQTRRFLSWYPFSGRVVADLAEELAGFETTKGSIHFSVAHPLGDDLVHRLVDARLAEVDRGASHWDDRA